MKKFFLNRKFFMAAGVATILIIASIPSYYFYNQYKKTQKLLTNPAAASQEEIKQLVKTVSRLIDLPPDEIPTVATVADVEKLKNQPFFARAKTGDKVLIYANAKKAILYDPVANKIIEVSPVNIDQTNTATPSATPIIKKPTATKTPSPKPTASK